MPYMETGRFEAEAHPADELWPQALSGQNVQPDTAEGRNIY